MALEREMIETTSIPVGQDTNLAAFLRYLPRRVTAFERRILRHRFEGWNPAVLGGDLRRLAVASGHYGLIQTQGHLLALAQMVGEHFADMRAPDPGQVEQMFALLAAVNRSLPFRPETLPRPVSGKTAAATDAQDVVADAPNADLTPLSMPEASVITAVASIAAFEPLARVGPVEPVVLVEPVEPGEVGMRRIFHLSDGNAFALELEQRLESEGYAIEAVESVDELSELFLCLMPQLLLVDASHLSQLAIIGALRREAQQSRQPPRHIQMVVMATQDDLKTRRAAHRAGADLLLFPPFDITDLSGRLHALNATVASEQVRVLIVEDNRADAFFAQSVLTRVGMQVEVEHDPMKVIDALKSQRPDLILMDLHMPFANGVEVTMLIREHPLFARVPIVFLSGESDADSHLEAINAGGDDFLFKPIRPRHLIAAVQDRVRRTHPVTKDA